MQDKPYNADRRRENEMTKRQRFRRLVRLPLATAPFLFSGSMAVLEAGSSSRERLVNVADTAKLTPGLSRWIAEVYNASYLQFGFLVVAVMTLIGITLGYCCDRLMSFLGLDLGKIQHHE